ncbi:protein of unknown function [Thiomonas sp. Bio17B3]|nr:protein of unknown function [Thiomonas sp. Bio17B3]VDY07916.1 protein of unknown function [Thiomonas sp. Sup16B3]VDY13165.1 protein of unknown function [Thiomonas sp. OC7]VDY17629.1 protein of unknown function [Thiomonas sp. CB2]
MGESRGNSGGIRPPTDEKKPDCLGRALFSNTLIYLIKLVRPAGFEPTTPWFAPKLKAMGLSRRARSIPDPPYHHPVSQ